MRAILIATAVATTLLGAIPISVHAQQDASLYQDLGQRPGLERLMNDFVERVRVDARLKPFFEKTDLPHLKTQLVLQVCAASGGPCQYKGPDMKTAHANMDVTRRDFNALVEVLQDSMSAQGIAFPTQNRLLALLAPMHREIINTR